MSNNAKYGDEVKSTGESHTEFGRSVESKAQIADACRASSDSGAETLNVYRLVPIAAKSDPRWQSALNQGEVVVAARTSGDARIVASACELDYMEVDAAPAEGVSTSDASAFRDEKLYTVIEVEHAKAGLVRGLWKVRYRSSRSSRCRSDYNKARSCQRVSGPIAGSRAW
ncbi:hypothetical protein FQZ97_831110 [compost metagenome]